MADVSSVGAPRLAGVLETPLYVDDMAHAVDVFERVLGLSRMLAGDRLTAFDVGPGGGSRARTDTCSSWRRRGCGGTPDAGRHVALAARLS